ncbi:uncharacterized protein LOC132560844 [Ylistrum balloti]|uniref:uncharacterized protein LOC132560844 n=1 Tax=Ylistrum balloti TaxID=509963 RepID=UPI002905911D|nr:uncharacterized protein LOC132560844 [Ylistrum balloti]
MHFALTKLAKLVIAEWPLRKLIIDEGFDEPTQQYPDRQHGNTSLYYEGRAATIAVSEESDQVRSQNEGVNQRFYQLVQCAGLRMLKSQTDGYKEVCVGEQTDHSRRKRSLRSRRSTGSGFDSNCKDSIWPCIDLFHGILADLTIDFSRISSKIEELDLFQSGTTEYPSQKTVEDVCGDIDEIYSRDNMIQMQRLLQYPYNDFEFQSEGSSGQTCGSETRRCVQDTSYSYSSDPLRWPNSRIMTPRLASRLSLFNRYLIETDVINPCFNSLKYCAGVCIPEEWSCAGNSRRKRQTGNYQKMQRGIRTKRSAFTTSEILTKYQNNGRAIQIDLSNMNVTMEYAASLAVFAGFDFVAIRESYLDVYVKNQAGIWTSITPFPLVNLIDVNHPTNSGDEYVVTDERLPLYDGYKTELKLSDCYSVSDIQNQGTNKRYFRFDSMLLQCLDEASYEYGSCIPIVKGSAYRTISINDINIEERHIEERQKFPRGKAVEIIPVNTMEDDPMYELGITVVRTCTALLRLKQMKIGIGTHSDRLYLDIRESTGPRDLLTLWNVDNLHLYNRMKQVQDDLFAGGPMIRPTDIRLACKDPPLGEPLYYIRQPASILNTCIFNNQDFCEETMAAREKAVKKLLDNLVSVVGSGQFSESSIREEAERCFITNCGGCLGRGSIWTEKTKSCMSFIKTFLSALSVPFGGSLNDNAVFYNMDRPSNISSVACDSGNVCFQDMQFYSILMETLEETYQPNPDMDVEEVLYGPSDNPLPVLDLLDQERAISASGVVKIYLTSKDDLIALYPILKILMTYNRNVKEVEFNLADGISRRWIISSLKNKMQRWSTSVCPSRSRISVAPYRLVNIAGEQDRRKRFAGKASYVRPSKLRNDELAWLMRN